MPRAVYRPVSKTMYLNPVAHQEARYQLNLGPSNAAFAMDADTARTFLSNLRGVAANPHAGSDETRNGYSQWADELEYALAHNPGYGVAMQPVKSAGRMLQLARHEGIHLEQYRLGEGQAHEAIPWREFLKHPIVQKAADTLSNYGYRTRQAAAEIPAYIASGEHDMLGLTPEEADEAIRHYVELLVNRHGPQAAKQMFRHARSQAREAVRAVTAPTVKGFLLLSKAKMPGMRSAAARAFRSAQSYSTRTNLQHENCRCSIVTRPNGMQEYQTGPNACAKCLEEAAAFNEEARQKWAEQQSNPDNFAYDAAAQALLPKSVLLLRGDIVKTVMRQIPGMELIDTSHLPEMNENDRDQLARIWEAGGGNRYLTATGEPKNKASEAMRQAMGSVSPDVPPEARLHGRYLRQQLRFSDPGDGDDPRSVTPPPVRGEWINPAITKAIAASPLLRQRVQNGEISDVVPSGMTSDADLVGLLRKGWEGRNWYREWAERLKQHSDDPEAQDTLLRLMAALGQSTPVAQNYALVHKIYSRLKNGLMPDAETIRALKDNGILRAISAKNVKATNLTAAIRHGNFDTPKLQDYLDTFLGNEKGVPGDIWMHRLFFGTQHPMGDARFSTAAPNERERDYISGRVQHLADMTGLTPAQTQAALWLGYKQHVGDFHREVTNTVLSDPRLSERKKHALIRDVQASLARTGWDKGGRADTVLRYHKSLTPNGQVLPMEDFPMHDLVGKHKDRLLDIVNSGAATKKTLNPFTVEKGDKAIMDLIDANKSKDGNGLGDHMGIVEGENGPVIWATKDDMKNLLATAPHHVSYIKTGKPADKEIDPNGVHILLNRGTDFHEEPIITNPEAIQAHLDDPTFQNDMARVHELVQKPPIGARFPPYQQDAGALLQHIAALAYARRHPDMTQGDNGAKRFHLGRVAKALPVDEGYVLLRRVQSGPQVQHPLAILPTRRQRRLGADQRVVRSGPGRRGVVVLGGSVEKAISAFLPKREPIQPNEDATDSQYRHRWSRNGDIAAPEDLPPLLYHVTTNLPAVLTSGYLRPSNRADQGGLGAVPTDEPHVSFTKNYRDAHNLMIELKRLGQIARGERDHTHFDAWRADDEKRAGLPEGALKDALEQAIFDYPIPDASGKLSGPAPEWYRKKSTPERNFDTYKAYLSYRDADKGPTDPVFIGEAPDYARVLPHRLGIVAVRPSTIPEDYYAGGAVRHYYGDPNNEVRLYGSHLPLSEETRVVTPNEFAKSILVFHIDEEALEKAFYAQKVVDATGNPTGEYRFTTDRNRKPVIQDAVPPVPKEARNLVDLAKQHGLTLHGIQSGKMMGRSTNVETGQTSMRPIGATVLTHTYSGTPGQWQALRAALWDTTGDIGDTPESIQEARRGGTYNPTATLPGGGFTYLDPKTYTMHKFVPQEARRVNEPKRPWSEHDAWLKEQMQGLRRPSERLPQQRGVQPQAVESNPLAHPIPEVTPEGWFVTDTGRNRDIPTLEKDPLGVPVPVEVPEAVPVPPEPESPPPAPAPKARRSRRKASGRESVPVGITHPIDTYELAKADLKKYGQWDRLTRYNLTDAQLAQLLKEVGSGMAVQSD